MFATFLSLVALTGSPDAVEFTPGAWVVPTECDADVIVDFNDDLGEATVWVVDANGVHPWSESVLCGPELSAL